MTRARDLANIIGSGATSSGVITAATLEATGDTAAGDNAAIGFTSAEGLILTGQGTTGDVTIKNDADALVAHVPTGTTGVTFAGTPTFPDGSINIADLDIDGGTDIGAALVDADLMVVDDGAGGTNKKATMSRLATYMGTKIGGGLEFISSTDISNASTFVFTGFDASKYDIYKLFFSNLTPENDNTGLSMVTSTDGGSNYDTGSNDYTRAQFYMQNSYGQFTSTLSGVASISISGSSQGTASGEEGGCASEITIFAPHLAQYTQFHVRSFSISNGAQPYHFMGSYNRSSAADVDALRFAMGSGNIASGTFTAYGLVNS
jgi:hypothetical protein